MTPTCPRCHQPMHGHALLTPREREVLALLAQGSSPRATAAALFMAPKTEVTHVRHLLEKLGLRDRYALIAYAARLACEEAYAARLAEEEKR